MAAPDDLPGLSGHDLLPPTSRTFDEIDDAKLRDLIIANCGQQPSKSAVSRRR